MKTVKPHQYAGKVFKPGDSFFAEPQHVPALLRLGRAVLSEHHETLEPFEVAEENSQEVVTRDMVAGASSDYLTRNMTSTRGRNRRTRPESN